MEFTNYENVSSDFSFLEDEIKINYKTFCSILVLFFVLQMLAFFLLLSVVPNTKHIFEVGLVVKSDNCNIVETQTTNNPRKRRKINYDSELESDSDEDEIEEEIEEDVQDEEYSEDYEGESGAEEEDDESYRPEDEEEEEEEEEDDEETEEDDEDSQQVVSTPSDRKSKKLILKRQVQL